MNLNFCGYGSPGIWATEQMFGGAHRPLLYGEPNITDCPSSQGIGRVASPQSEVARDARACQRWCDPAGIHTPYTRHQGASRPERGTLDDVRKHIAQPKWSPEERQAFADGVRLRATTLPDRRKEASRQACRGYRPRGQGD